MNKPEPTGGGQTNLPKLPSGPYTSPAKSNVIPVGFALVCVILVLVLWMQRKNHTEQAKQSDQTITSYSNQVAALDDKLARQVVVNTTLETNLAVTKLKASNDLATIEATLSITSSSLEKARAEARSAEEAMVQKDKKIADLEDQNTELDKQSYDLRGSITNLETQIQATQKKLDTDEGDKKLLMSELARLRAQKDDLEKKLNDLAFLKEQVRTLRDELSVARRLDWIRRGIYAALSEKGGERLIHPLALGSPATNSPLDVELHQNGAVKINSSASADMPAGK